MHTRSSEPRQSPVLSLLFPATDHINQNHSMPGTVLLTQNASKGLQNNLPLLFDSPGKKRLKSGEILQHHRAEPSCAHQVPRIQFSVCWSQAHLEHHPTALLTQHKTVQRKKSSWTMGRGGQSFSIATLWPASSREACQGGNPEQE